MTVGELIKKKRLEKGLTQKQLGERAKIAEPTIRRYELGKLNPKYETIQKIAAALGVNPLELFPQYDDVVLVVRCRDCKWFNLRERECCCPYVSTDHEGGASYSINFDLDDFCSYGERKEVAP